MELTKGYYTIVDDEDFDALSQWKWSYSEGYAVRNERGSKPARIAMARQLMGSPINMQVDHINGDKLDNRRINLRICTHQQNQVNKNKRRVGTSKYKGVSWYSGRGKWMAQIAHMKKLVYIGLFENEEDAALAYNFKAAELHGEFARFNTLTTG